MACNFEMYCRLFLIFFGNVFLFIFIFRRIYYLHIYFLCIKTVALSLCLKLSYKLNFGQFVNIFIFCTLQNFKCVASVLHQLLQSNLKLTVHFMQSPCFPFSFTKYLPERKGMFFEVCLSYIISGIKWRYCRFHLTSLHFRHVVIADYRKIRFMWLVCSRMA